MRRETLWFGGTLTRSTIASADTAAVQTSLNAAALALRPFTIVRTRGLIHYRSDQEATSENYSGAYGQAVVTDQAVGVGVTAVPTPVVDSESDAWFVYEALTSRIVVGATTTTSISNIGHQVVIDSKAMRKVESGFDIVTVAETSALSSGMIFEVFFRTFVKLH